VASGVTIKRIEEFEVAGKYSLKPPDEITGLARCGNPGCVSNNERDVTSSFVRLGPRSLKFRCRYCERVFELDQLEIVLP